MRHPRLAPIAGLSRSPRVERLENGLRVCLLENRQAPVITTALCYRAGSRDEIAGQYGVAHFLEHMMFKGSAAFGPGEIDRRTQRAGGSNNAFTTHDATAYYFSFASDRWQLALEIEADRMAGLTLDPEAVASERDVILEELAMVRDDPWEALVEEVRGCLYGEHPYGRSVLGDRRSLAATGPEELAAFHRRFYRPDNAVLIVAGDLEPGVVGRVTACWQAIAPGAGPPRVPARPDDLEGLRRVNRRRGDVARVLFALPIPGAEDEIFPALRMLSVVLGSGRTSRLHRTLVDDEGLCSWVGVEVGESVEPGMLTVAAEVVPGVDPQRVEDRLLTEIGELRESRIAADDLERARRVLAADWVFGHERIHQQALTVAWSAALFDPGYPTRQVEAALDCDADLLLAAAGRFLDPTQGGVIGWSLPERTGG